MSFPLDDQDRGRDWADSTGLALMGLDFALPGHFGVGLTSFEDVDACWLAWVRQDWPTLRSALREAYLAAHEQSIDGVLKADRALMASVPASDAARARLGSLAERVVDGIKGAKHARFFDLYRARVGEGDARSPALAMAVRAATFHLNLFDTVSAWFYYEWRSAWVAASGVRCRKGHLSELSLNAFFDEPEHIAAVAAASVDDREVAVPSFQIVGHDRR